MLEPDISSPDFTETDDISHHRIEIDGRQLHVAEIGAGPPLVFIHGWPEFWLTWLPVAHRLKKQFRCIMPCLYGFGRSDKPEELRDDLDADFHARDIAQIIAAFCDSRPCVLVGHDVGSYVLQSLARLEDHRAAGLVSGLVFFNCPTASVGDLWVRGGQVNEIWYQSFHLTELAIDLVGHNRETTALYFRHFLKHWTAGKSCFDAAFDRWVDNFNSREALIGGFSWYKSNNARRLATIDGTAVDERAKISLPSAVLWGEDDPVLRSGWSKFLSQHFETVTCETAQGAGHFVHVEQPQKAADFIVRSIKEFAK